MTPEHARNVTVDLDLHGVVGIRLVDPSPADVTVVQRQLALVERPLARDPDVVVRFVDDLLISSLRFVEYQKSGFTDDGFYVLRSGKRAVRVRIAFEGIGDRCEIVCQRGVRAVPFLMSIVIMTALARGCVPLQASAFAYEGTGVLVTGWATGGKTEALLAFSARGARYIGDEWILLTGDGRRMYGLGGLIPLHDWHLRQLPAVRSRVAASRRMLFGGGRGIDYVHGVLSRGPLGRSSPVRMLGAALPALRRQLNVQMDPADVFGSGSGPFEGVPQKVFLMIGHDLRSYRVDATEPGDVADRMVAANLYAQQLLFDSYIAHRFAFPKLRSKLLERAESLQLGILQRALAGKDAFVVRHPHPCDLGKLFDTMAPHCAAPRASSVPDAVAGPPAAVREMNFGIELHV